MKDELFCLGWSVNTLGAVILAMLLTLSSNAHAQMTVELDARNLSVAAVQLNGGDSFSTNSVNELNLPPGSHTISYNSGSSPRPSVDFFVLPDGFIDYDRRLDQVLSGRGTPRLTVLGLEISLDATSLTAAGVQFSTDGFSPISVEEPFVRTVLPGGHYVWYNSGVAAPRVDFEVLSEGTVEYLPALSAMLELLVWRLRLMRLNSRLPVFSFHRTVSKRRTRRLLSKKGCFPARMNFGTTQGLTGLESNLRLFQTVGLTTLQSSRRCLLAEAPQGSWLMACSSMSMHLR